MSSGSPRRVWTVAEAKARLSEILRLAGSEGPQRIGARRPFVVVPAADWDERASAGKSLGQWLVENSPKGQEMAIPNRRELGRPTPFSEEVE